MPSRSAAGNPDLDKQTGVLLHPTSLFSLYGVGGLGREAFACLDFLKKNGHVWWQILPLYYPGYGDSPYNPISTFAGNPLLIDPGLLFEQGLLNRRELDAALLPVGKKVDFPLVIKARADLLRKAYAHQGHARWRDVLADFIAAEADWLQPFAVFSHLKDRYRGLPWQKWKTEDRIYRPGLFERLLASEPDRVLYPVLLQYLFHGQLAGLKNRAAELGIGIIGDLPLYVALDSCDTWSRPELFELDIRGLPLRVAGVPPDAFARNGQLWGNPLYRWDVMARDGFAWWKSRLRRAFAVAGKLRLDHFIGLVNYWAVDAKAKSALEGSWLPGPKYAFFDAMLGEFPQDKFIAEDLGILTGEVNALRDHYGFPGMIILQFCFEHEFNDVLAFPASKVIYTGTHDNRTTRGWFNHNKKTARPDNAHLENYLRKCGLLADAEKLSAAGVSRLLIELARLSPCHIAIAPLQDHLALDDSARLNIPGRALGNWRWRLDKPLR